MEDTILLGRGRKLVKMPENKWKEGLAHVRQFFTPRLAFMTPDHHRVRNFVVTELPRNHSEPLRPEDISRKLQLPLDRVSEVLDDLVSRKP